MKKALILLNVLLLISTFGYAQQGKESKNINQSLTIGISPSFCTDPTFFATFDENLDSDTFWPTGFFVTKNFMLKPRLSFTTGIHLLYKKMVDQGYITIDFGSGYSGPMKTTYKLSFFDIPLQLNYYILKPNDKLNLYAKTEIKNSLIVLYSKGEPNIFGKYSTHIDNGYDMFLGIGFGLDFKVVNRLSFVIEPGFNYSVIGLLPEVGIFDCKLGIKYVLTKK
jgi:hypothetical protein